jgi:hypothetical protein
MEVEGCLDQREGLTVMSLPLRNSDTTSMTCATSQPMPMHQSATGPDCAGVHAMYHHAHADGSQCGGTTAIARLMPITSRDHPTDRSVVESKMGTSKVADPGYGWRSRRGQAGTHSSLDVCCGSCEPAMARCEELELDGGHHGESP